MAVVFDQAVESTNIARIKYDDEGEGVLTVEFNNGGVWNYPGVLQETAVLFAAAPSKGRFFHQEIKGKYEGVRADGV